MRKKDVGSSASKTAKAITIGAGAGLLGSLVGMGGGLVAIPALTGWLRLTQVRLRQVVFKIVYNGVRRPICANTKTVSVDLTNEVFDMA